MVLCERRDQLEAERRKQERDLQVSGGHTSDGSGSESLAIAEHLAILALVEDVLLEMRVSAASDEAVSLTRERATEVLGDSRREVDGGEGNVTAKASGGAFVKTNQAELLDDVTCSSLDGSGNSGSLSLHLQPNLDDLEGVGEDLFPEERPGQRKLRQTTSRRREAEESRRTTWHPPAAPPARSSQGTVMRPVSGFVAYPRTRSLTVSLMAFSGATPCFDARGQRRVVSNEEERRETNDELRRESTVESEEPFVLVHLLYTV